MLSDEIAYVRITLFLEPTARDLASALSLAYASNRGKLSGLILDLRNNPGGILGSSVGVAAVFLPGNALITRTEGRIADSKKRFYASEYYNVLGKMPDPLVAVPRETVPMVVLVNRGSAGGSEIVAASLQDHHRATIIGERTFGLGTLQTILPLYNKTALKLTTARYYTPNGAPIDGMGVVPDIVFDGEGSGNAPSPRLRPEDDPAVIRATQILQGLLKP